MGTTLLDVNEALNRGKTVKIIFILGTHRTGGNSDVIKKLVEQHRFYKYIEPEYIYLRDRNIQTCMSCYKCTENGKCCINDDVEELVEIMKEKDSIIFVPVVYGFGTGTIFQSFIERMGYGYLRMQGRPLRDKIAGLAVIGRRYAHEAVANQLMMNILLNEMIIYGSGFIPLLHGKSFPGEIINDEEGIYSFNNMIERIIDAKLLKTEGGTSNENFTD